MKSNSACTHIKEITSIRQAAAFVCEACLQTGDTWVHLRTCQICGTTLCCDSSPNQHMTQHFQATGHKVAASAEPGERWMYCYEDKVVVPY